MFHLIASVLFLFTGAAFAEGSRYVRSRNVSQGEKLLTIRVLNDILEREFKPAADWTDRTREFEDEGNLEGYFDFVETTLLAEGLADRGVLPSKSAILLRQLRYLGEIYGKEPVRKRLVQFLIQENGLFEEAGEVITDITSQELRAATRMKLEREYTTIRLLQHYLDRLRVDILGKFGIDVSANFNEEPIEFSGRVARSKAFGPDGLQTIREDLIRPLRREDVRVMRTPRALDGGVLETVTSPPVASENKAAEEQEIKPEKEVVFEKEETPQPSAPVILTRPKNKKALEAPTSSKLEDLLGLLPETLSEIRSHVRPSSDGKKLIESIAMETVTSQLEDLGYSMEDVSARKLGYDLVALSPRGKKFFIEVKGRWHTKDTVVLTRNEIQSFRKHRTQSVLAIVRVAPGGLSQWLYLNKFPWIGSDFEVSRQYRIEDLEAKGMNCEGLLISRSGAIANGA